LHLIDYFLMYGGPVDGSWCGVMGTVEGFWAEVLGCVVMAGMWSTGSSGCWVVVMVLGASCILLWIIFCVAGAWLDVTAK